MTTRKPTHKAAAAPAPRITAPSGPKPAVNQLVSYVVDDDGHERTLVGIITDVLDVDGTFCARVANLPDPLVLPLTSLTLI